MTVDSIASANGNMLIDLAQGKITASSVSFRRPDGNTTDVGSAVDEANEKANEAYDLANKPEWAIEIIDKERPYVTSVRKLPTPTKLTAMVSPSMSLPLLSRGTDVTPMNTMMKGSRILLGRMPTATTRRLCLPSVKSSEKLPLPSRLTPRNWRLITSPSRENEEICATVSHLFGGEPKSYHLCVVT